MAIADILKKLLLGRAFAAEGGRMTLLRRFDVCLYEARSFAYIIQKFCEQVGEKNASKIFKESGKIAVKRALEIFGWKPSPTLMQKVIKNLLPLSEFYGWGKWKIVKFRSEKDKFSIIVELTNSPLVTNGKSLFGDRSRVCIMPQNIAAGGLSVILGKDIDLKEVSCHAKGAPSCVFEGGSK